MPAPKAPKYTNTKARSDTKAAPGERANAPPAKVMTALPPLKSANIGKQWPNMAAATAT